MTTIDVAGLQKWVSGHLDEMVDELCRYVEVETPSHDIDALAAGRDFVLAYVQQRLGEPATVRTEAGGQYGDTVVLQYPGSPSSPEPAAPVVILAHYDTVWPLGTLGQLPFSVEGDVVRGPGVFDMKAGLVQALWAVNAVTEAGLPLPPLRLVLNGDEEIGSPASRRVIEESCEGARAVLVFEASADGAVKTARKGVGLFDVTLTGIEAHAGLDPTSGASAISALAKLVRDLHALTDLSAGTTVNVGLVSGGTGRNVTAGSATAGIDVRVSQAAEADRIDEALRAWRPSDPRVRVVVSGGWNRPVMARTPQIAALFELASALAGQLGLELAERSVGGASDGNFAAALGCPVLDGLGAVGGGAHARTEHATLSGMVERAALTAALLVSLAAAGDQA